ncbi:MAG: hypothetical protein R3D69_00095 [Xanthobacteraceae bacterium]
MPLRVRQFLVLLVAAATTACAPGPLSPTWRVDADTAIGARSTGAIIPELRVLPPLVAGDVPLPQAARSCGHSSPPTGVVAALRPGVGARIHVAYWTSGPYVDSQATGFSTTIPFANRFDFVLRLIPPDGALRPDEEMFLNTLLLTNRLQIGREGKTRQEAAQVLSRWRIPMWNALVRTLCVEFVRSRHLARNVLSFKVDIRALCRAIPIQRDRRRYAAYLLQRAPTVSCPEREVETHGSVIGANTDDQQNAPADVAATSALPAGPTGFYMLDVVQVAAVGEISVEAVEYGDALTSSWSLAEWEGSGICAMPGKPALPRITAVRLGHQATAIADGHLATHRIVRRLGHSYSYSVEPIPGVPQPLFGVPIIPRSDLALITSNDVTAIQWQVDAAERDARTVAPPRCSRRLM